MTWIPSVAASAAMAAWSCCQVICPALMSRMKCLATFRLLITFPAVSPVLSGSVSRPSATRAAILARSSSVAASRSSRLRARSPASTGYGSRRAARRESPGK